MRSPLPALPVLFLACWALAAGPVAADAPELPRLAVAVEIEPVAARTFDCRAEVTDLATGEVVAAPRLRFREGEEAVVTMGREGEQLRLEVVADTNEGTARWRLSLLRGETETTLHRTSVRLR